MEIQEKRLMSKNTPAQESLQLATPDGGTTNVEKYEFEPIKGYRCSTGAASAVQLDAVLPGAAEGSPW